MSRYFQVAADGAVGLPSSAGRPCWLVKRQYCCRQLAVDAVDGDAAGLGTGEWPRGYVHSVLRPHFAATDYLRSLIYCFHYCSHSYPNRAFRLSLTQALLHGEANFATGKKKRRTLARLQLI